MKSGDDLPPEIGAQLLTFLREVNGQFEVADKEGLVKFVAEYGERYPPLLDLFSINKEAALEHFKRTGEVLPGMKIVHTNTREGDNVTKLEIFRGPIPPKDSDK
jgi:hypothetical protein